MTNQPEDSSNDALAALIEAARSGDREAGEKLLADNLDLLHAFIRRRLGSRLRARETSQDLAQSVCREVLGDLDTFEGRGSGGFEAWLLTCAENKIRKRAAYWNRDRRDMGREERSRLESLACLATPSWHLTSQERLERVETAIRDLAPDYQEVLILSRIDGLTQKEVAERMGRTPSSVQNLLFRALARLGESLR